MNRHLAALLLVAGCGSPLVGVDDVPAGDAGVVPAPDATVFGDGSSVRVDGGGGTPFNGGGPFLCGGCVCDGTLYDCVMHFGGGGGGAPVLADAGDGGDVADAGGADGAADAAAACPLDAGVTSGGSYDSCTQIPVACLPKPTCACIAMAYPSCLCAVDPSGSGFLVSCVVPPNP